MAEPLKTVRDLILVTADYLADKGVDSARLNAERLLGDVLGLARIDLYLNHDRPLTPDELDRYRGLVKRRAAGEPLQALLGETEFYGRGFKMAAGVFIPRPETERLVETCLGLLTGGNSSLLSPLALEIGCGSGVIACTLAAEIPRLRVIASDISGPAVELGRVNARRLGVAARVEFLVGELDEPFPADLRGRANLLVSNPPYIRSADVPGLPREVLAHDPVAALDGGPDGLRFYHELARRAAAWLFPGGWLAVEIGHDQPDQVSAICAASGLAEIEVTRDYNDLPRVVTARLPDVIPQQQGD
ncbi:peptide chain release factor N(5)-glutamine methyltransferase [bacterium]|nr:peptide chain release factor N(5)-glutamine methyltransferase [bacterium]MBU1675963.1 peptide chain release factor N(5)-glutamine methyltransferase [bacterium]